MDEYRYLIDSAQASSSRTRAVIFLMLLACFLSAVALWNELDTSWLHNRQISVKRGTEWFVFKPDQGLRGSTSSSLYFSGQEEVFREMLRQKAVSHVNEILDEDFAIPYWTALKIPDYFPIEQMKDSDLRGIKSSASLIKNRLIYTNAQADTFLNALIHSEVNNRLSVRIPILGIVFDINDLAIISGAAFNILLFVFWFSLAREKKNIKFIFRTLEDDNADLAQYKKVYQLAAMKQVFHIPPELPRKYSSRFDLTTNHRINNLTYPIVLLPLVVNLSIFIYDRFSAHYGNAIDPDLTRLQFWTSLVLVIANALLTVYCTSNWRSINNTWYRYHARICQKMEQSPR